MSRLSEEEAQKVASLLGRVPNVLETALFEDGVHGAGG